MTLNGLDCEFDNLRCFLQFVGWVSRMYSSTPEPDEVAKENGDYGDDGFGFGGWGVQDSWDIRQYQWISEKNNTDRYKTL